MRRAFWLVACLGTVACASSTHTGGFDTTDDGGGGAPGDIADSGSGIQLGEGGDPGHIDPDAACLTSTNMATAKPASVLFQLDVSGSMNCPASDTTSPSCAASASSRFTVLRTTLETTLGTLPTQNSVGLMHYPTGTGLFSGDPTGCVARTADVALGPLTTTRAQVATSLDSRTPAGGTPTHDALRVSLALLAGAPNNRFLVLATDGDANFCAGCDISCDSTAQSADNDAMIADVAAAAQSGIRTFVIGVPGSQNFRSVLSRLAEAGGTSATMGCSSSGPTYCHYDMTTAPNFGAALQAALSSIGGAALSCTYDIPTNDGTFDPTRVNVELTSGGTQTDIPRDPSHMNGWDYSSNGTQIVLYGAACDSAKHATNGAVTILYGCKTVIR